MPEMPHTLTVALHREEDWFIAQCLEVDVASQGRTIGEVLAGLAEAVELYLEEVDDPAGHVTATPLVTSFHLPRRVSRALADLLVCKVIQALESVGFAYVRTKGSHAVYRDREGRVASSRSTAW